MPLEKRNQFLDAEESDDDGSQGYDSEAEELRKGGGRTAKRRKVDDASDDEGALSDASDDEDALSDAGSGSDEEDRASDQDEEDHDDAAAAQLRQESLDISTSQPHESEDGEEPFAAEEEEEEEEEQDTKQKTKPQSQHELPGLSKPLSKKNLVASEAAVRKSGVVYISRLPPFMKPQKLRSLLEAHGAINRIFCSPEDPAAHARRVRAGGNKKKSYTEGWVEFVRKKDAKRACELLNAQTIGGKKGSYYRDDIWTLRYLKGFKWHHLTEQISAENAERTSRMRAEIAKTTRENKEFVRNVEQAKVLDGMRAKREAKRKAADRDEDDAAAAGKRSKKSKKSEKDGGAAEERTTTFKQIPLVDKKKKERIEQPEQVQRVLSKIF
ncbi:uncharacterized protein E0L32_001659 [Thyridium curvatum]|uniref:18S rRNA factor 2 n=1 Tax=Thyridium curvatum TaxID=1093900 RepID=A0A507AW38_9PEZI|nr:uncharacterized protein E0L32_001539 [Thyridium curvatum]XP_030990910.1 uncharacterized protein E0L32_001659 [Thyridium curvatum]TPX09079.1 hypothetical protein E0L32_001539 [Thyridium curvatum]TPX09199.1 hypothetical protein E0L32_001659 [Thyridium curvatum]